MVFIDESTYRPVFRSLESKYQLKTGPLNSENVSLSNFTYDDVQISYSSRKRVFSLINSMYFVFRLPSLIVQ